MCVRTYACLYARLRQRVKIVARSEEEEETEPANCVDSKRGKRLFYVTRAFFLLLRLRGILARLKRVRNSFLAGSNAYKMGEKDSRTIFLGLKTCRTASLNCADFSGSKNLRCLVGIAAENCVSG